MRQDKESAPENSGFIEIKRLFTMAQTTAFRVSRELATAKRDKEILIKTGHWAYPGAYGVRGRGFQG
jgi:hypothetical protein